MFRNMKNPLYCLLTNGESLLFKYNVTSISAFIRPNEFSSFFENFNYFFDFHT